MIENEALSKISIHIVDKVTKESLVRTLEATYIVIQSIKLAFNEDEELLIFVGTKCGKLLVYSGF